MERSFDSLTGNRKLVGAAVATAIVLGALILQQVGATLLGYLFFFAQRSMQDSWPSAFPGIVWGFAFGAVTFALGYFLCLWLLAPIAAELRLVAVMGRSLLAVAGGAVVAFTTGLLGSLFTGFDESAGLVFGWAYGALATASGNIGWATTQAAYNSASTAISLAPLAVLAGVVVWVWLRTQPLSTAAEENSPEV